MSDPARKRGGLPMRVKMRHDNHFVEELTARHETPVGKMIPLSAIEPDPGQPRSTMGDLDDLVQSIRDKGVLEPILVRPRPGAEEAEGNSEGGPSGVLYRIISGERRYRASQEAGLYEVPAIEMDVTDQEALEIALIENLQRKDLTPFEEAEGYRMLAESHQYTHEEIAEAVGKSRTVITESLSLLQMPPRVRDTVQALGLTSKSLLLEVLKAGSEGEMIELLEEVARRGLNRDDLRQRLRRSEKGGRSSRRKPYVFRFKSPDRSFSLSLAFRQSEVDKDDLIQALEQILADLRQDNEK
ncbi:MAG: ParB/RepB/Spo0J family partition protein [Acidobacteria bacterium]|nr:ParB/RepB/Spo0J family partition protein [Acidobacteriota bacterium]